MTLRQKTAVSMNLCRVVFIVAFAIIFNATPLAWKHQSHHGAVGDLILPARYALPGQSLQ
jgi:uncharacterized membrane protein YjjB (DUF3815 family)